MISYLNLKRLKRDTAEFNRYSIRRWVVLSLIISMATTAVLAKTHLANLWVYAAAMTVPVVIAFHFKDRIVLLRPFGYSTILVAILGAALLFGT